LAAAVKVVSAAVEAVAADYSDGSDKRAMTLFLASVRSPAEAEIALRARVDIIDLKDPAKGALGAVDRHKSVAILGAVAGRSLVSATIGDVPPEPRRIQDAVLSRAHLGVDFVKFGLFPSGEGDGSLDELRPLARRVRLIVTMFADLMPAFDAIAAAASMGARGIMLDTANKDSGSLRDHFSFERLSAFVTRAKAHGLTVGLAGSLRAEDVPDLLALRPDLLGFRGALCSGSRTAALDADACAAIRALIPQSRGRAEAELPEAAA
jgi:(5-formylfuran-3-yl)methyl phosphate synthase